MTFRREGFGGQRPCGGEHLKRRHRRVALRRYDRDLRIEQFLLGVQDVEDGAAADLLLLADALKAISSAFAVAWFEAMLAWAA